MIKRKAVVLGANYYIGLSVIRCLGKEGVHVTALDYDREKAYAFSSKYCSEIGIAPNYKSESERFLKFLCDYADMQDEKPVLFPTADPYVAFMDENFDILKEKFVFPSDKKGLCVNLMDKNKLYKICEKYKVKYPETVYTDDENFFDKVENLLKFPCMLKPADSATFVHKFRQKMFLVKNKDELKEYLKKADDANLTVFAQRIIPGFDDHMYTYDAYLNQSGEVTHWTTCQKYRQFPINFGASVYTAQHYVKEIADIGRKFLQDVGFKGFAEIEFKKDAETGEFYLIEVNVRTTNFNTMLNKCGLNMPYIAYREMCSDPVENFAVDYDTGIVFWCAYEDMFAVRDYIKKGQLTRTDVFKSLFKKKAPAIWDIHDMKPFVKFSNQLVKKGINKFTHR